MRRFPAAVAAAVVVSTVLVSGRAGADLRPIKTEPSSNGHQANVAVLLDTDNHVIATTPIRGRSVGNTTAPTSWTCRYFDAVGKPGAVLLSRSEEPAPILEVGKAYWLVCIDDDTKTEVDDELFLYDPANPFGPIGAADRAFGAARAQIVAPEPVIATSPPRDRAQLVGLATWLWVSNPWTPLVGTASIGGVTATVTATPSTITWDPGDGTAPATCDGPGKAYDATWPDAEPTCSHTYIRRSTIDDPAGTFPLKATVTYTVAWSATNGDGGDLEPITATATVPLVVHEIQAVIE